MKVRYTVVFDRADDGYTVTVPALPGLVTGARTMEEARSLVVDAIRCHLESMAADGEAIPMEMGVAVEQLDVELAPV